MICLFFPFKAAKVRTQSENLKVRDEKFNAKAPHRNVAIKLRFYKGMIEV